MTMVTERPPALCDNKRELPSDRVALQFYSSPVNIILNLFPHNVRRYVILRYLPGEAVKSEKDRRYLHTNGNLHNE